MQDPEPVLRNLIEFVLNRGDITGTKIEQYLKIAVSEARPQNYKPRVGKINSNIDKFSPHLLKFMFDKAETFITVLGYKHLFISDTTWYIQNGEAVPQVADSSTVDVTFIKEYNDLSKTLLDKINSLAIEKQTITINRVGNIRSKNWAGANVDREHTRPWKAKLGNI